MSKKAKKGHLQKAKDIALRNLLGVTTAIKSALAGGGDIVQAVSNAIQRSGKAGLFQAWMNEWSEMCEKGKASPDFVSTDMGHACLQELIDFLDKELPDKARFEVMKTLFCKAAATSTEDATKARCLQLMRVCRGLDATELLILSVVYKENHRRKHAKPTEKEVTSAEEWPKVVATASGEALSVGLVERYEPALIEKSLIGDRGLPDRSGIRYADQFRLTHFGLELGTFLQASHETKE